jgi:hypothetical protein
MQLRGPGVEEVAARMLLRLGRDRKDAELTARIRGRYGAPRVLMCLRCALQPHSRF